MAQTPALFVSAGEMIDYTPGTAVLAGAIVVLGSRPLPAPVAIAASAKGVLATTGNWKIPQKAEIQTAGGAVYWDTDGNPYGGTASSGACTATASTGYLIGFLVKTTAATDSYALVSIRGTTAASTVGGAITATDLEAEDASLGINGIDAVQGGAIALAGGTSSTAGNAGGAVTVTGGTPGATGIGGAVTIVAGTGGTTSGAGGVIAITSGAGTNNASGGAITIDSGAPNGTGVGGAITIGGTNAASLTFGKMPRIPVTALTAGGTAIGNANAVSEGFNVVAGADDTAAVILPTAVAGMQVIVKTTAAGKNLIVFPAVGGTINNVGANTAYNMVADEGCSMFIASNTTQWYSLPLVSS